MADLVTVPTFTFPQGKLGDEKFEQPIRVEFYNGTICLVQDGEFEEPERIRIHPDFVEKLFKEIKKHTKDANFWLEEQRR